jgi:hypothetical protein
MGKSEQLYDLRKLPWEKNEDLHIICCAKLLKPQWEKYEKAINIEMSVMSPLKNLNGKNQ